MLIVTRKLHESIQIGDDITITLHQIKGKQARIAIEAPENVKINRRECVEKKSEKIAGIHRTVLSMDGKAPRNTQNI